MNGILRRLARREVEVAYSRYLEVFDWLNAKGIRQWLRALPRDAFRERCGAGQLFAYCIEGEIAAVVTLAHEANSYWPEKTGEKKCWWLKSLAVAPRWRSHHVGERTVRECERAARQAGAHEMFLDCVDAGFLPGYYARLGYEEIGRKNITYPSGNTFLVALMTKKWRDGAEPENFTAESTS